MARELDELGAEFLRCIGGLVLMLAIVVVNAMLGGYVASCLWAWFVVPQFDLPPLTIPHAIGLSILLALWTHEMPTVEEMANREASWARVGGSFMLSVALASVALGFGWVVHFFV